MMLRSLILPAVLVGIGLPTLAAVDLRSGQYRVTTVMSGQSQPSVRFECFGPDDVDVFALPEPDEGTRCEITRNTIASGRIDLARTCTDDQGRHSEGSAVGTYSDTGFNLHVRLSGDVLSAPVEVRSVGQRLAATCVAD